MGNSSSGFNKTFSTHQYYSNGNNSNNKRPHSVLGLGHDFDRIYADCPTSQSFKSGQPIFRGIRPRGDDYPRPLQLPPIPRSHSFHQVLRSTENGQILAQKGTIRGIDLGKSQLSQPNYQLHKSKSQSQDELSMILKNRRCKSEGDLLAGEQKQDENSLKRSHEDHFSGNNKSCSGLSLSSQNNNHHQQNSSSSNNSNSTDSSGRFQEVGATRRGTSNGVAARIQRAKYKAPQPPSAISTPNTLLNQLSSQEHHTPPTATTTTPTSSHVLSNNNVNNRKSNNRKIDAKNNHHNNRQSNGFKLNDAKSPHTSGNHHLRDKDVIHSSGKPTINPELNSCGKRTINSSVNLNPNSMSQTNSNGNANARKTSNSAVNLIRKLSDKAFKRSDQLNSSPSKSATDINCSSTSASSSPSSKSNQNNHNVNSNSGGKKHANQAKRFNFGDDFLIEKENCSKLKAQAGIGNSNGLLTKSNELIYGIESESMSNTHAQIGSNGYGNHNLNSNFAERNVVFDSKEINGKKLGGSKTSNKPNKSSIVFNNQKNHNNKVINGSNHMGHDHESRSYHNHLHQQQHQQQQQQQLLHQQQQLYQHQQLHYQLKKGSTNRDANIMFNSNENLNLPTQQAQTKSTKNDSKNKNKNKEKLKDADLNKSSSGKNNWYHLSSKNKANHHNYNNNGYANVPLTFDDNFILCRSTPTAGLIKAEHRYPIENRYLNNNYSRFQNSAQFKQRDPSNDWLMNVNRFLSPNSSPELISRRKHNNNNNNNKTRKYHNQSYEEILAIPGLLPPPRDNTTPPLLMPISKYNESPDDLTPPLSPSAMQQATTKLSYRTTSDSANYSDEDDDNDSEEKEEEIKVILKPQLPPPPNLKRNLQLFDSQFDHQNQRIVIDNDLFDCEPVVPGKLNQLPVSVGTKRHQRPCWTPLHDLSTSDDDDDMNDDGINSDNDNGLFSEEEQLALQSDLQYRTRFTLQNQLRTLIQNGNKMRQRHFYP